MRPTLFLRCSQFGTLRAVQGLFGIFCLSLYLRAVLGMFGYFPVILPGRVIISFALHVLAHLQAPILARPLA